MRRIEHRGKSLKMISRQHRWNVGDARIILGALDESGISIEEFCRKHRLQSHRVEKWHKRLRTKKTPQQSAMTLLPLRVIETTGAERVNSNGGGFWSIEIELGDYRVRVEEKASEAALVRSLRAVKELLC